MKYTKEITDKLLHDYARNIPISALATQLSVPERSVIAKLSSLGVYKKKNYVNKRGEVPIKKSEYIERIGKLLDMDLELLESLEKVNKLVLIALEKGLSPTSSEQVEISENTGNLTLNQSNEQHYPKSEQFDNCEYNDGLDGPNR